MKAIINFDKRLFLYIYNKTSNYNIKNICKTICKFSKPFFIVLYICIILYTYFVIKSTHLFNICIIKPLATILICKCLRIIINRKRPFLVFPNLDLPKKNEPSMPSNHTASSFIISFMLLYINLPLAIIAIVIATISSTSRIIIGIHFPLDILAGFLIALSIYLV